MKWRSNRVRPCSAYAIDYAEYNAGKLKEDSLTGAFEIPEKYSSLQKNLGAYDGSFILTSVSLDITNKHASDVKESVSGCLLLKLKAR